MQDFRKLVQARFRARMADALPQFRPVAARGGPAAQAYRWQISGRLAFFVVLDIDPERRAFSTNVAWGDPDADPTSIPLGDPATGLPFNAPAGAAGVLPCAFSIGLLWRNDAISWQVRIEDELALTGDPPPTMLPRGFANGWVRFDSSRRDRWIAEHPELYPQSLEGPERLIYPLVDDLVQQVVDKAMPRFRQVADEAMEA
jgi:hypothetical protein